jgi:hypothetical protein
MSGGGYATLTMFMKSKHKINKFSSWVPLSDLIQWYKEAQEKGMKYDDEILSCTNSENGILNKQIAKERSPLYMDTPIHKFEYSQMEIYAGINDKTIPFTHSTNFYNKLVNDLMVTDSTKYVTYYETLDILQNRNPLGNYPEIANRKVILKKEIGNLKLILFDGGHEILQRYAFDQLFE